MKLVKKISALVVALCAMGTAVSAEVTLLGAGASFPAPLMTAMADEYRELTNRRVTLNYQSIGSGGGMRQFKEQTIMFGMTEAFFSDSVMRSVQERTGGQAFHMPITLADVVLVYNVPGVESGLVFDGPLLVDIFKGRVKTWNDRRIRDLNPNARLPRLPIQVVHRSDASGTTNLWTSYFSRVSTEWANSVGFGTSVKWPTGIGAKGNEGVAGVVSTTPGTIGYVSFAFALLNDMHYASLRNRSGNVIKPSLAATSAAADIELPADTRVLFTDTPAPQGYPVAGFAWMLFYENMDQNRAITSKQQAEELVRFVIWAITDGQKLSEELGYARLPKAAVDRNKAMIRQMKWQGEEIGKKILDGR